MTQAIWLAKSGFNVIGSDLSEDAINRARNVYANEKNANFVVDDILNSNLKDNEFDCIFDRGVGCSASRVLTKLLGSLLTL